MRRLLVLVPVLVAVSACSAPHSPAPTRAPSYGIAPALATARAATSSPPTTVRVEYPTTAGHVQVRAVPLANLTARCLERRGVARVVDRQDRVGYATAADLTVALAAGLAPCNSGEVIG